MCQLQLDTLEALVRFFVGSRQVSCELKKAKMSLKSMECLRVTNRRVFLGEICLL